MLNFAMRSMILAACLTAVACTDEQASAPEGATAPEAPVAADGPAVAAPEASPAPMLTARTAALEGLGEVAICALDSVNDTQASDGTFTVSAGQPILFQGWAAMSNMKSPDTIRIILDGKSDFEISHVTGVARKDVADAYRTAELGNAGFNTGLPALDVPADKYSVILAHDEAGTEVVCKTNLSLIVTQ